MAKDRDPITPLNKHAICQTGDPMDSVTQLLGCGKIYTSFCRLIGSSRTLVPVAAKIALQIAGAITGTPGSPTPAGAASLGTMCTWVIRGASGIRATGSS